MGSSADFLFFELEFLVPRAPKGTFLGFYSIEVPKPKQKRPGFSSQRLSPHSALVAPVAGFEPLLPLQDALVLFHYLCTPSSNGKLILYKQRQYLGLPMQWRHWTHTPPQLYRLLLEWNPIFPTQTH